ncbi:UMP kinase, partial [Vibrio vulnificus]
MDSTSNFVNDNPSIPHLVAETVAAEAVAAAPEHRPAV